MEATRTAVGRVTGAVPTPTTPSGGCSGRPGRPARRQPRRQRRRRSSGRSPTPCSPGDCVEQQIGVLTREVEPPQAEDQRHAAGDERDEVTGLALVERRLDRHGRRQDRLAEHDDEEQRVALGDVVRMPRGHAGPLRPGGYDQLAERQRDERRHARRCAAPAGSRSSPPGRGPLRWRSDGPSYGAPGRDARRAATGSRGRSA